MHARMEDQYPFDLIVIIINDYQISTNYLNIIIKKIAIIESAH